MRSSQIKFFIRVLIPGRAVRAGQEWWRVGEGQRKGIQTLYLREHLFD